MMHRDAVTLKARTLTICMAACILTGAATCFAAPNPLLTTERWREHTHGLSLLPPLDSRMAQLTADDAVTRIIGPGGYAINVFFKRSLGKAPLDLELIQDQAIRQMGGTHPNATIHSQKLMTIANRSATLLYFFIPATKNGPWATGEIYILLDSHTCALLQLEVPRARFEDARPVFEAVADSIEFQDPREIEKERAAMIEAAVQWLKPIEPGQWQSKMTREQWFRIVENNNDVGYMQVTMLHGPLDIRAKRGDALMGLPGIRVDVQARIELAGNAFDTISNFFVSDDRETEVWSIRTTRRPLQPTVINRLDAPRSDSSRLRNVQQHASGEESWAETGLRSKKHIELTRRSPSGDKEYDWTEPEKAYLSQAELYLMPGLLPRKKIDMGFYSYYPISGKIAFRTERIEPLPSGGLRVYSRPAPDENEQITDYDINGNIMRRELPGGREMLPATKAQIIARWRFLK